MTTPYQRWDDHMKQNLLSGFYLYIQMILYIRLMSDKFTTMIWNGKNSNTLICGRFLILWSIPILWSVLPRKYNCL